jgi:two-component system chemotaxis sensor kinase CheA
MKLIQGVVFDESFDIITILFIPEVMNRFKRLRNIDTHRRFSSAKREFKRILVVDDSYTTREIEKSILELENYNVTTAVDGIDGLEKLKEQRYDLIITDIHMPRMDGLTLVENLRKDETYQATPIIIVSSDEDPEKRHKFEMAGASSYIVKSEFDRGNLIREVKTLID